MLESGKNSGRLFRGFLAIAMVGAGSALVPASGFAATVSVSGNTLTYNGERAEANNLVITPNGPTFTISDSGAPITATPPLCTGGGPVAGVPAECSMTSPPSTPVTRFVISLGQGDDSARTAGTAATIADTFDGGGDTDTYSYQDTSTPVVADLDGNNDDGRDTSTPADGIADEGDNLINTENVTGGSGADTLRGSNNVDNTLQGGQGSDTIDGLTSAADGDTASFETDNSGVQATVPTGLGSTTTVGGGGDTLTRVENLIGGSGGDALNGNAESNRLFGRGGTDAISAGAGDDPVVSGEDGDDELNGGAGDDTVTGGAGNNDTASFAGAPGGVTASLASETATGDGNDVLDTTERLRGGSFSDILTGDDNSNILHGEGGNDQLLAGTGAVPDTLNGGPGNDTLSGDDGTDTLSGNDGDDTVNGGLGNDVGGGAGVFGGPGNDIVNGDNGSDLVNGEGGDDTVNGGNDNDDNAVDPAAGVFGGPGNDTLTGFGGTDDVFGQADNDVLLHSGNPDTHDGGTGTDEASYASLGAATGITADLTTGQATTTGSGAGVVDALLGIENLTGGAGNDNLNGDGNPNVLQGRSGFDILTGGGAGDTVDGGGDADGARGGGGNDTVTGGDGNDAGGLAVVNGGIGDDNVSGGLGDDLVEGDDGADTLNGNAGDDAMDGGTGSDTASFSGAPGAVTASLATGTATGDAVTSDQLVDTENLSGTEAGDTLTGSAGVANVLSGQGGDDTLNSQDGGADTDNCGAGTDRANADAQDDVNADCEQVDLPGAPETSISSGPGAVTDDSTPTHTVASTEAGSTFECRYDGGEFAACSGPGATHTPAEPLADGEHTFEARATDVTGNTDATPASQTFLVSSPQQPGVRDETPPQTFLGRDLRKTTDTTPKFRFGSNETGSRFQCKVDNDRYKACRSPETVDNLDVGKHVFRVRAIDPSGNVDPTPAKDRFKVEKKKDGGR